MNRRSLVLGSLGALAAISCAAGAPQGSSYVLLDPQARASGVTVQVDDHAVTSALPIEVPAQAHVTLLGPSREEAIAIAPGELVYVAGPKAIVSHLEIGRQVEIDKVHVTGDDTAARELATQLGGKVTPDAHGLRLDVSEVFAATAAAHVPEHLMGIEPMMIEQAPAATTLAPRRSTPSTPIVRAGAPAAAAPVLVPMSEPTGGMQVIEPFLTVHVSSPVSFTPAAEACEGVGGVWRGRVYSDRHLAYYDFTLNVRQHGSQLQGSMLAHFWDGSTDQVEPPGACDGAQHVKVVESATGSVDEAGTMHFESRGWQVSHHMCGDKVTEYWPDRFEVPLASGATSAAATLKDDRVWTDGLPIALTRVSCGGT